jgi:hypothetical protein
MIDAFEALQHSEDTTLLSPVYTFLGVGHSGICEL